MFYNKLKFKCELNRTLNKKFLQALGCNNFNKALEFYSILFETLC